MATYEFEISDGVKIIAVCEAPPSYNGVGKITMTSDGVLHVYVYDSPIAVSINRAVRGAFVGSDGQKMFHVVAGDVIAVDQIVSGITFSDEDVRARRRMVRETVDASDVSTSGSLGSFIEELASILEGVPEEHRGLCEFDISSEWDGTRVDFEISYLRNETDSEVRKRLEATALSEAASKIRQEAMERAQYEALKRKYE